MFVTAYYQILTAEELTRHLLGFEEPVNFVAEEGGVNAASSSTEEGLRDLF